MKCAVNTEESGEEKLWGLTYWVGGVAEHYRNTSPYSDTPVPISYKYVLLFVLGICVRIKHVMLELATVQCMVD